MGINTISKVMPMGFPFTATRFFTVSSYYCIFTLIILQQISALRCPPGIQYWNSELDTCLNCTKCSEKAPKGYLVVLRPCQVHRDTQCGPISKLRTIFNSESSAASHSLSSDTVHRRHHNHRFTVDDENDSKSTTQHDAEAAVQPHRRHRLSKHHRYRQHHNKHGDENWRHANNNTRHHTELDREQNSIVTVSSSTSSYPSDMNESVETNSVRGSDLLTVNHQKLIWTQQVDQTPFSNVETLVWDWQAIVLAMAVCACILFFVVAAVYSVHHARQWKRLKDNFEADVEELSARLNLMVASGDIADNLEPNFHSPINDGNYHNNRCVYLEQLLVRKDTKMEPKRGVGNVYIEEKNGSNTGGSILNTTSPTEKKSNND